MARSGRPSPPMGLPVAGLVGSFSGSELMTWPDNIIGPARLQAPGPDLVGGAKLSGHLLRRSLARGRNSPTTGGPVGCARTSPVSRLKRAAGTLFRCRPLFLAHGRRGRIGIGTGTEAAISRPRVRGAGPPVVGLRPAAGGSVGQRSREPIRDGADLSLELQAMTSRPVAMAMAMMRARRRSCKIYELETVAVVVVGGTGGRGAERPAASITPLALPDIAVPILLGHLLPRPLRASWFNCEPPRVGSMRAPVAPEKDPQVARGCEPRRRFRPAIVVGGAKGRRRPHFGRRRCRSQTERGNTCCSMSTPARPPLETCRPVRGSSRRRDRAQGALELIRRPRPPSSINFAPLAHRSQQVAGIARSSPERLVRESCPLHLLHPRPARS